MKIIEKDDHKMFILLPQKMFLANFSSCLTITFYKCSLTENDNYLVKAMNKFASFFINVEKHKAKSRGGKMTILFIKSNEKFVIEQMGFEFESLKLELQFHAQAQTIQLITTKMFDDILHVSK